MLALAWSHTATADEPAATSQFHAIDLSGAASLQLSGDLAGFPAIMRREITYVPDVRIAISPRGQMTGCAREGSALEENLAEAMCAQLLEKAQVRVHELYDLAGQPGFLLFRFIATESSVGGNVTVQAVLDGGPFVSPPQYRELREGAERNILTRKMATLSPLSRQIRYPILALNNGWYGRVVLLVGINAKGEVKSCRPLESSGNAYLDNRSCVDAGRMRHDLDPIIAEGMTGLSYRRVAIDWKLEG
ncbi:TonB family protein [Altererythrobacter sp.]|nr:TonB family protein [Altererythrobacter sp.]